MEREDKKGIFFGVIGVLTLIIAIIGASFAYFSINAKSSEDAVIVNAASVQIVYKDGQQLDIEGNLIPAGSDVVKRSITRYLEAGGAGNTKNYRMCVDDNGFTICDIYDFSLTNNGADSVSVTAVVEPGTLRAASVDEVSGETIPAEIPFINLKFALYDISEGFDIDNPEYQGSFTYDDVSKKYVKTGLFGATGEEVKEIPGEGTSKKYRMLIWLNEAPLTNGQPTAQDYEQGATFRGTVKIDVSNVSNGQVTGTVAN